MNDALAKLLLVAPLALGTTGCYPWFLFDDFEDDDEPPIAEPQQPDDTWNGDSVAPTISVNTPSWPPLGPDGELEVTVRDASYEINLEFSFAEITSFLLYGPEATARVTGTQLGEGFGALQIEAWDQRGNRRYFTIDDFLVDLSPPEVVLGSTVLGKKAGRYFEFWAADAWVLGDVEVRIDGTLVYAEDFEDGYPGTLGTDWDLSLVQVPTLELPGGTSDAVITLRDAAGNQHDEAVTLDVDADPPLVTITSPSSGAQVSGLFEVHVNAVDVGGGPAWIELSVGGTPVATGVGPDATLVVDANDLTPGNWELVAKATDEAGLESTTSIPIEIVAP